MWSSQCTALSSLLALCSSLSGCASSLSRKVSFVVGVTLFSTEQIKVLLLDKAATVLAFLGKNNRSIVGVLPPYLNSCHRWCTCRKFNLIYRKYVQHFVTPSVLHCKSFTKTCHEHHVCVLMHVIKSVDQFP